MVAHKKEDKNDKCFWGNNMKENFLLPQLVIFVMPDLNSLHRKMNW